MHYCSECKKQGIKSQAFELVKIIIPWNGLRAKRQWLCPDCYNEFNGWGYDLTIIKTAN